jgi:hypothetical protein
VWPRAFAAFSRAAAAKGWQAGGIEPGKPDSSLLIKAVTHASPTSKCRWDRGWQTATFAN